jgi:hypothetical protein
MDKGLGRARELSPMKAIIIQTNQTFLVLEQVHRNENLRNQS